jgi:hypothetical protein
LIVGGVANTSTHEVVLIWVKGDYSTPFEYILAGAVERESLLFVRDGVVKVDVVGVCDLSTAICGVELMGDYGVCG